MKNQPSEIKNTTHPTWTGELSASESPTVALARLIAAVKGCNPHEITPLYHSIDCESLNRVIEDSNTDLTITFPFEDFMIEVNSSGHVKIVENLTALAAN